MIITGKLAAEFQKEMDRNTAKHQNGKINSIRMYRIVKLLDRSKLTR